jgi:hypothetical protein
MYDEIQQILAESTIVHELQVIELIPYGGDAFRAKLRAGVTSDLTLQVWINHNDRRTRYAYQLFRHGEAVLRWDNAPHHPEQGTNFPHHFHDEFGRLAASSLTGDPVTDLPSVLAEIKRFLQQTNPIRSATQD